jgi:S1-C subfamily serine protease
LTSEDKRFLQAALAFEGHYNGLLDGAWGKLSQRALENYSRREFGTGAEDWHMAMLAWSFFDRASKDGWAIHFLPGLGLSVLWPEKTIVRDPESEYFHNYRHSQSSLSISIGIHAANTAQSLHDYTMETHAHVSEPYSVRKASIAVSSATASDGSTLYTRSDYLNGSWSTIMLSASQRDGPILNAVAASISKGRIAPLRITVGGKLDDAIKKTLAVVEDADSADTKTPAQESRTKRNTDELPPRGVSGSGFIVSEQGHLLTNEHVVKGCEDVLVDGKAARVVGLSEEFDLALVKLTSPREGSVAVFAASSAKLNSDVTAVGYPYAGLLGGLNVTRGSVSSLTGLGGQATTMQVTAPIQSGNSGGPLLASDGEVVGVVVAKLDAEFIADALGDVPQNVNFAIRGEIAKLFLAQNGVDPKLSLSDERLEPEETAERARSFTAYIECR